MEHVKIFTQGFGGSDDRTRKSIAVVEKAYQEWIQELSPEIIQRTASTCTGTNAAGEVFINITITVFYTPKKEGCGLFGKPIS